MSRIIFFIAVASLFTACGGPDGNDIGRSARPALQGCSGCPDLTCEVRFSGGSPNTIALTIEDAEFYAGANPDYAALVFVDAPDDWEINLDGDYDPALDTGTVSITGIAIPSGLNPASTTLKADLYISSTQASDDVTVPCVIP